MLKQCGWEVLVILSLHTFCAHCNFATSCVTLQLFFRVEYSLALVNVKQRPSVQSSNAVQAPPSQPAIRSSKITLLSYHHSRAENNSDVLSTRVGAVLLNRSRTVSNRVWGVDVRLWFYTTLSCPNLLLNTGLSCRVMCKWFNMNIIPWGNLRHVLQECRTDFFFVVELAVALLWP